MQKMSVITLTSDFGNCDYRVPAIKGKIISGNPEALLIDITHEIPAYDLNETAYILRRCYRNFPKGSVHIVAVDCLFHPQRRNLIYSINEHYFLAADNGVMSLIHPDLAPENIYEITYNNRFDDVVDFVPTDIFVPTALHLIQGGLPEVVGRKIQDSVKLSYLRAVVRDKFIIGEVTHIDCFGNLVTNISKNKFEEMQRVYPHYTVRFRNLSLSKIVKDYAEFIPDWNQEAAHHGKRAAVFNDAGYLELIIYKGSKNNGASKLFGMKVGERVFVEFQ